jgi:NADPH:quinone reductase-like Zn-dependent oxidoreductase
MKALVIRGHGDAAQPGVSEIPTPVVSRPSDVLVRLRAAALNHLDLWTLRGLPGLALSFPHVLGADGAGTVEQTGSDARRVRPGDRVLINPGISCYHCSYCLSGEHSLCESYRLLGEHLPGTLAEYIVVPEGNLALAPELPERHEPLSWGELAAFSLVTLTAWRMLVTRSALRPGETVFVWGVGGGVSLAALRIAKLCGARVIVTSSSETKLAAARGLGADVTLNHAGTDVVAEVRRLTDKRGVDVVVEHVGAATWERSLKLLARGGRLVTCGATTGPKVEVDVRRLFWHQWDILGSTMGSAEEYRQIVSVLAQGQLRPVIDSVFPLERGADALARLASAEQFGKVVVEV